MNSNKSIKYFIRKFLKFFYIIFRSLAIVFVVLTVFFSIYFMSTTSKHEDVCLSTKGLKVKDARLLLESKGYWMSEAATKIEEIYAGGDNLDLYFECKIALDERKVVKNVYFRANSEDVVRK